MFKRVLSLAIILMLVMSMAAVAVSAAQVEIVEDSAETPVEVGAESPAEIGAESPADTGAEGGAETGSGNKIYFDAGTSGWNEGTFSVVSIYLYVPETGEILIEWGSRKKGGMTNEGNGIWSFDFDAKGLPLDNSTQYCVIFLNDIGLQTCDLLMDTSCFGDTAICEANNFYENTDDSNKRSTVVRWKNNSTLGPKKAVTSLGHIVGEVVPAFTSPYKMFVEFLANSGAKSMTNAMQYAGGKTAQQIIDEAAESLGLKKDDVKQAIEEAATTGTVTTAGVETCDWSGDWDPDQSSLSEGESEEAHQTGDGGNDGGSKSSGGNNGNGGSSSGDNGSGSDNAGSDSSDNSGSGSGSSGSGSGGSGSGSSGVSGSGSGSKTGQETTVLFIMLGMMAVAAGVIIFGRKKSRG